MFWLPNSVLSAQVTTQANLNIVQLWQGLNGLSRTLRFFSFLRFAWNESAGLALWLIPLGHHQAKNNIFFPVPWANLC